MSKRKMIFIKNYHVFTILLESYVINIKNIIKLFVYEREDRIGGLITYGIPNMKLEKETVDRRVRGNSINSIIGVALLCIRQS